jgi:hypothetical protein
MRRRSFSLYLLDMREEVRESSVRGWAGVRVHFVFVLCDLGTYHASAALLGFIVSCLGKEDDERHRAMLHQEEEEEEESRRR